MSRILLIEDDPFCTRFVEGVLKRAGHSVVSRTSAIDALDMLGSIIFELVISDVNIPGGVSGFELVQTIRKTAKTSHLPIAFYTGRGEPQDVKRALACGADDYMVKPVDAEILISKVTTLLTKNGSHGRDFACRNLNESANVELEVCLSSFSEAGVTLILAFPIPLGSKIRIRSNLFNEVGIGTSSLRILSCDQAEYSPLVFLLDACFVGLSEASLQMIRRWNICNPNRTETTKRRSL